MGSTRGCVGHSARTRGVRHLTSGYNGLEKNRPPGFVAASICGGSARGVPAGTEKHADTHSRHHQAL